MVGGLYALSLKKAFSVASDTNRLRYHISFDGGYTMQLDAAIGVSGEVLIPNIRLRLLKMLSKSISGGLEVAGSPKAIDKLIADYIAYKAILLYAHPSITTRSGLYFGIVPQLTYILRTPDKPTFITTLLAGWHIDTPKARLRVEVGADLQVAKRKDGKIGIPVSFFIGTSLGFYLYSSHKAPPSNPQKLSLKNN